MNKIEKAKIEITEQIKMIKENILKNIDGSKKTVAFVSYLLNCRNQVGNLHKVFKKAGFNVINIVDKCVNDRFEKQAPTFFIPKQIFVEDQVINTDVDFDFIDLIIAPDREHISKAPYNEKFLSKRAKRIYLTHNALEGGVFDYFDYVLLPSKVSMDLHSAGRYRKNFSVIPGGYPKLDYSIERYKTYSESNSYDEDSVLYAPTLRGETCISEQQAPFLVGFDSHIIETLVKNLDEKIIFRPHPHDFNCKVYHIDIIKEKFKDVNRVEFNLDQQYLDKYKRSKFIITDSSDTVFTYSFTTLKPAISFIPLTAIKTLNLLRADFRESIGYIAKTLGELIDLSNKIIKNQDEFKEKILNTRESLLFNIGKSGEYLIENIDYILSGKKHPDWMYF